MKFVLGVGAMPESMEDVIQLADAHVDMMDGSEDENASDKYAYIILAGLEAGIPPIKALQHMYIMYGKTVGYLPLLAKAIVLKSGLCESWVEERLMHEDPKEIGYKITFQRKGAEPVTITRRVKEFDTSANNWQDYPDRMVRAKVVKYICQDYFPDAIGAMVDEMETGPIDVGIDE